MDVLREEITALVQRSMETFTKLENADRQISSLHTLNLMKRDLARNKIKEALHQLQVLVSKVTAEDLLELTNVVKDRKEMLNQEQENLRIAKETLLSLLQDTKAIITARPAEVDLKQAQRLRDHMKELVETDYSPPNLEVLSYLEFIPHRLKAEDLSVGYLRTGSPDLRFMSVKELPGCTKDLVLDVGQSAKLWLDTGNQLGLTPEMKKFCVVSVVNPDGEALMCRLYEEDGYIMLGFKALIEGPYNLDVRMYSAHVQPCPLTLWAVDRKMSQVVFPSHAEIARSFSTSYPDVSLFNNNHDFTRTDETEIFTNGPNISNNDTDIFTNGPNISNNDIPQDSSTPVILKEEAIKSDNSQQQGGLRSPSPSTGTPTKVRQYGPKARRLSQETASPTSAMCQNVPLENCFVRMSLNDVQPEVFETPPIVIEPKTEQKAPEAVELLQSTSQWPGPSIKSESEPFNSDSRRSVPDVERAEAPKKEDAPVVPTVKKMCDQSSKLTVEPAAKNEAEANLDILPKQACPGRQSTQKQNEIEPKTIVSENKKSESGNAGGDCRTIHISKPAFSYLTNLLNLRPFGVNQDIAAKMTMELGKKGTGTPYVFSFPIGIATTKLEKEPDIILCDTGNNLVKVFTWSGKFKRALGTEESGAGFRRPSSVVVDENHIFVKDDRLIQKFTTKGELVMKIGEGHLRKPYGLRLTERGLLVTLDHRLKAIVTFDSQTGRMVKTIPFSPLFSSTNAKFRFIAVHKDNIAAVNLGEHKVIIASLTNGSILKTIGSFGNGPAQFNEPSGITADKQGNLLIADSRNNRIQIFAMDGKYMGKLSLDNSILRPSDIYIMEDGHLLVDSYLHHCIKIFKLG